MAEHRSSVEIAAGPDAVFDHLVTADGMTAWMGTHAELDARVGGRFAVDVAGHPVRGTFLVVDRPRRVVVTWGFAGSADLPPGTSRVSFTLTPTRSGTRVDLVHGDLPDLDVPGHAAGWAHFTERLARAAAGTDPGPDRWRPEDLDADTPSTSGAP
ncbi:MAG: SRPBCC family protein [Actinomycetaceae bacterium]